MDSIFEQHTNEFGEAPLIVVAVPGICTLLGSYADFCKGWSLVATGTAMLEVAISEREDQMVRLLNATLNDRKRFSLNNIKFRKEDRWGNYIKGVIGILANEGVTFPGLDVTVSGPLLHADNPTISTAIAVGVCMGLNALFDLHLDNASMIRIAYQANTVFNNEVCKLSNLVTTLQAQKGTVLFFDLQHITFQEVSFPFSDPEGEYIAMVIDSKIPPSAMREEISLKRKATKKAFEKLQTFRTSGFIREFPEIDLSARVFPLDEETRHICGYILMESRLANEGVSQLENSDALQFGKTMNRVQSGLRDLFEITCPEVDWLTKRAMEIPGCIGAVSIANGFSGNILVLLSKDAIPRYIGRLEEYEHIFGFHPRWYVFEGMDKARIVFSRNT